MSFLDTYNAEPGIAGVRFTEKQPRTLPEIAKAHAKAVDALFVALYPELTPVTEQVARLLPAEQYFIYAAADIDMLRAGLQRRSA